MAKEIRDRVFDIVDCETPTIAKVGAAYGMVVNIALACDFVLAADDARFCDSLLRTASPRETAALRSSRSRSGSVGPKRC